jgi:hypothetical protein
MNASCLRSEDASRLPLADRSSFKGNARIMNETNCPVHGAFSLLVRQLAYESEGGQSSRTAPNDSERKICHGNSAGCVPVPTEAASLASALEAS